ncbi:MAG TPA: extracellular solute-binding protein [Streptosporangiaceae bacterium]|jgi:iron(III) transport system substrate-binding protein
MRVRTRRAAAAVAALAVAAGASGCAIGDARPVSPAKLALGGLGAAASAQAEMRGLYKKAVDGGETMVIVYGPNETNYGPVNAAFGKRFPGIKVIGEPYTGAQLESRLAVEHSSGKHVADVLEDTSYTYRNLGYNQPFTPATAARLGAAFRDDTGQLWGPSGTLFGFSYNTQKIKPADAPARWSDLVAPRFKGEAATGDPGQPSATSDALIKLQAAGVIDDTWLRRLAADKPGIEQELELANSSVARGEYGISLVNIFNFYAADRAKGAPLRFVYPKDGVVIEPNYYGVARGAPHPAAARLFLDWLFTSEAQRAYAGLGVYPLMPGAPTGRQLPPMKSLNVLKVPDPTAMDKLWDPGTAKLRKYLGGAAD